MTTCPHCHQFNAVITDRDLYGPYEKCMMCGWYGDTEPAPEVPIEFIKSAARRTHKRYSFAPDLYILGAPIPRRESFTSRDEHRAIYRRWSYWNRRKPKETA